MKLTRPVLASAAAVAIAAGSFSVVNAQDKDTATENTLIDAAPAPNSEATVGEAAPINDPAAQNAPAAAADTGTTDAGADTVAGADTAAAAGPDTGAAEIGTNTGPGTASQDAQALVNGLAQQGQDNVDPAIAALAETVPAPNAAPATVASMRKITNASDAPKQVSGDRTAAQTWYGKQGVEGWYVHSESMNRDIPIALVRATDESGKLVPNAPTLYMLNGAGGSEQSADWISIGDAHKAFKGKGVNIVVPMEGAFSYYVDWLADGETLKQKSNYFKGAQKWSTFLGEELPPAVEKELGANDKRGVVGFSMSATSSLLLAEHYPDKFDAVGSFSGCAATSTPLPWAFSALTVNRAAKQPDYTSITPAHIWGPMGSPYNRYNDALVNAEKLRGKAIYISNGSGTGSQTDMVGFRTAHGQSLPEAISGAMTTTVEGGVIEAATNSCTHDLRAKLNSKNIPAHYELRKAGTHAWPVWIDDMYRSWNTTIGPALVGENFVRAEPSTALPERATWNGSSN